MWDCPTYELEEAGCFHKLVWKQLKCQDDMQVLYMLGTFFHLLQQKQAMERFNEGGC